MDTPIKPGDRVVHAVHGLGEVIAVEARQMPAGPVDYVTIEVQGMRLMVPLAEMDELGIRPPINRQQAEEILELLSEDAMKDPGHAGRRQRNARRLLDGDAEAVAKVIRSLEALREDSGDKLKYRDTLHLREAMDKLASELALALEISEEEARKLVSDSVDPEGS